MQLRTSVLGAIALLGWMSVTVVSGATVATYDFRNTPGNQASNAGTSSSSFVNVGNLTRGAGLGTSAASSSFNSTGFSTASTLALSDNDYVGFTLSGKDGGRLTLGSLVYSERRQSNGPTKFAVLTSLDNFTGTLFKYEYALSDDAYHRTTVSLDAALFTNLASAVTFRIYGWGASNTSGGWRLGNPNSQTENNLIVLGAAANSVVAVPLPAGVVMGGVLLGGIALRRLKHTI